MLEDAIPCACFPSPHPQTTSPTETRGACRCCWSKFIAKPELMYPENKVFKSTRPSGSGDLTQLSTGHSDSGFALVFVFVIATGVLRLRLAATVIATTALCLSAAVIATALRLGLVAAAIAALLLVLRA